MRLLLIVFTLFLTACASSGKLDNAKLRADARIALGIGYMQQGDRLKARHNFLQASQHAPNYYQAQLSLAYYYQQVGELRAAEHLYQQAVKQHPNNGNVLNNYATFLCKQNQYRLAEHYFLQAIEQPDYFLTSASYENAALCALKAQQIEHAVGYFKRALDYQPNRPRSVMSLSQLQIDLGELDEARVRLLQFQRAIGLQNATLDLLIQLEKKAGNTLLVQQYQQQLKDF